jgi:CRP-like cAMP-binding protein
MQAMLDAGVAKNRAQVARLLGVSRARVTQVLNRLRDSDGVPAGTNGGL